MLKEDGTRQEIIAQQAVTMRQLTAAASQQPPEDADTVEEAPDSRSPAPLREGRRSPYGAGCGVGCSGVR